MPKIIKIISLCTLTFLFCFLTYKLCYFIAEKYFFDKLFYQKSVIHGYINSDNYQQYGERAKDIVTLKGNNQNKTLGISTNIFTIVVIGDSFTWGQGIRNNQRFVFLLNQKFNSLRPTNIISLAMPGWNILDYKNYYDQARQLYSPDLYIFTVVDNDNYINKSDSNNSIVQGCQSKFSGYNPIYDVSVKENYPESNDITKDSANASLISWNNPLNLCILDNSLQQLPTRTLHLFFYRRLCRWMGSHRHL